MNEERPRFGVGYCSEVFDMFHVGHLNLLRRARNQCHHLVVGVVSDEYAERLLGGPSVVPFDERIDIISALGIVDEVIIERSEDKVAIWQQRPFDVVFEGSDRQGTPLGYQLERAMAAVDASVVYLPYAQHTSSSMMRSFLIEGRSHE